MLTQSSLDVCPTLPNRGDRSTAGVRTYPKPTLPRLIWWRGWERRKGPGARLECQRRHARHRLGACYAYHLMDPCLNWSDALAIALKNATCEHGRGDPSSSCQKKLRACKACDICAILSKDGGPRAFIRHLGMDQRGCTERPWEIGRCPGWGNLSSQWSVEFEAELCADPAKKDDLAGVMIHEASHACPSAGGGAVYDLDPPGCTAYDITDACMGG